MMHFRKLWLIVFMAPLLATQSCNEKKTEVPGKEDQELFSERDRMDLAMKQEFIMTRDPALGYIPKERMVAALNYKNSLVVGRQANASAITWQERGPGSIAGRTRAFLIDSRDATGNTVFAASVSGGVWKATNFKATPSWMPVNETMGSLAVCALAQDPSAPNTIYAGTGEGWFNIDAVRGNGIWKSPDGGVTWNKLPSTDSAVSSSNHNFDFIQDLIINSTGVVFATARPSSFCNKGGVFRSTDGGTTWGRVIGTLTAQTCDSAYNFYAADLELASNGDVYATTGYNNEGENINLGRIFRSSAVTNGTNVGAAGTWVNITPAGVWQRIDMAVSPGNPAVLYALLQGTGSGIGAIKKSVDFGVTWTDLAIPNWCNQGATSLDFTNGQAFYNLIIQVDPNNANTVIIGGIDLFKSTDGGSNWNQITQWSSNCASLPVVHADQHNLQFFSNSSTELLASNDGGIYYSSNGGTTWATFTAPNLNGANQTTYSSKNAGYNVTQLYACDIHPSITDYFLAGAQDNGSQKFSSAGINTTVEASVGGDGGFCHIDQTNGNIQILSYVYNNFYYSRNNGASFSRISFNNNGQFINPSDYDDAAKVLYSGNQAGQMGLLRNLSGPGTPTFNSVSVTALSNRSITAIKVDPTVAAGGTIWIAGFDTTAAPLRPNLIKLTSANTLSPTVAATSILPASIPAGSYVSSIDVDPANAGHLLVTLSNYGVISVLESTDGGTTFNNVEGNLPDVPVRWGMFLPANASVNGTTGGGILLATEVGVWYALQTAGTGTVWTPQSTGLPSVRTDMLRYRPLDNLVAVATHGRGLFTTSLTSIATGIPTVPNTRNFIDYSSVHAGDLFIKTGNLNTVKMKVMLYDAKGSLVFSADKKYEAQHINISTLAAGTYILKLYGNKNEQYTSQFLK